VIRVRLLVDEDSLSDPEGNPVTGVRESHLILQYIYKTEEGEVVIANAKYVGDDINPTTPKAFIGSATRGLKGFLMPPHKFSQQFIYCADDLDTIIGFREQPSRLRVRGGVDVRDVSFSYKHTVLQCPSCDRVASTEDIDCSKQPARCPSCQAGLGVQIVQEILI
jgi:hypothetical protein